ncbi:MAG: hypothetical protein JF612_01415, partial [Planctomycetia bacterium]|nr:hypothetical protein [Planctomycetia bacterium]
MTTSARSNSRRRSLFQSRASSALRHRWLVGEYLEPRCLLAGDIHGLVWNDINRNGLLDAGEPGLPNALVELVATTDSVIGDADDFILKAAATDSAGNYSFSPVAAGQYYVRFLLQPAGGIGHRFTTANVGSDDSIDSDVIPSEGRSEIFSQLAAASTVISAGLIEESTSLAFAFTLGG